MKPTIEYRPKPNNAAPRKAARAVPEPKEGGRWLWVPDDKIVSLRNRKAARDRMREYMAKRRAKKAPAPPCDS